MLIGDITNRNSLAWQQNAEADSRPNVSHDLLRYRRAVDAVYGGERQRDPSWSMRVLRLGDAIATGVSTPKAILHNSPD
jgi:hypothetical protein